MVGTQRRHQQVLNKIEENARTTPVGGSSYKEIAEGGHDI